MASAFERGKHAAQEVFLLLFLIGLHRLLDLGLVAAFPEYGRAIHAARVLVFVAFLFGYVTQAVDIVFAVAPWTRTIMVKGWRQLSPWLAAKLGGKKPTETTERPNA